MIDVLIIHGSPTLIEMLNRMIITYYHNYDLYGPPCNFVEKPYKTKSLIKLWPYRSSDRAGKTCRALLEKGSDQYGYTLSENSNTQRSLKKCFLTELGQVNIWFSVRMVK